MNRPSSILLTAVLTGLCGCQDRSVTPAGRALGADAGGSVASQDAGAIVPLAASPCAADGVLRPSWSIQILGEGVTDIESTVRGDLLWGTEADDPKRTMLHGVDRDGRALFDVDTSDSVDMLALDDRFIVAGGRVGVVSSGGSDPAWGWLSAIDRGGAVLWEIDEAALLAPQIPGYVAQSWFYPSSVLDLGGGALGVQLTYVESATGKNVTFDLIVRPSDGAVVTIIPLRGGWAPAPVTDGSGRLFQPFLFDNFLTDGGADTKIDAFGPNGAMLWSKRGSGGAVATTPDGVVASDATLLSGGSGASLYSPWASPIITSLTEQFVSSSTTTFAVGCLQPDAHAGGRFIAALDPDTGRVRDRLELDFADGRIIGWAPSHLAVPDVLVTETGFLTWVEGDSTGQHVHANRLTAVTSEGSTAFDCSVQKSSPTDGGMDWTTNDKLAVGRWYQLTRSDMRSSTIDAYDLPGWQPAPGALEGPWHW